MTNKEKVLDMFKNNNSAYEIHLVTGLSFGEITHFIKQDTDAKERHYKHLRRIQSEQEKNRLEAN